MGTVRKRKPRKKVVENRLTDNQLDFLVCGVLLDGDDVFDVDGEHMPFESEAQMKAVWQKHRAAIMKMISRDTGYPIDGFNAGTRPFAWWCFDAPEPRRQLSGPAPSPGGLTYQGLPRLWETGEDCNAAVFETELEYLTRLDLLLPGELDLIDKKP